MDGHLQRLPVTSRPTLPLVGAEDGSAVLAVDDGSVGGPVSAADLVGSVDCCQDFSVTLLRRNTF